MCNIQAIYHSMLKTLNNTQNTRTSTLYSILWVYKHKLWHVRLRIVPINLLHIEEPYSSQIISRNLLKLEFHLNDGVNTLKTKEIVKNWITVLLLLGINQRYLHISKFWVYTIKKTPHAQHWNIAEGAPRVLSLRVQKEPGKKIKSQRQHVVCSSRGQMVTLLIAFN